MFKRGLTFAAYILLAFFIYIQAKELFLSFYVLFPLLLFPIFYFFDFPKRFLTWVSVIFFVLMYCAFLFRHRAPEMIFFGTGYLAIFVALVLYRSHWEKALKAEMSQALRVHGEFDTLERKHESRLESLHHLEKQVASLMDLFEIARDFSECLSFEAMADLLHKKVMPELPFECMRLILLNKLSAEGSSAVRVINIDVQGVCDDDKGLSVSEIEAAEKIREAKQMIKQDAEWIFPLIVEDDVTVLLNVRGASTSDLAKFEVLVAHLVLQVKKIRLYETVKELSIRDSLTGVFIRRHFLERLDDELKRSIKFNLPMALLMLDIDHFKRYNDDFGHLVGDATLKEVAALLETSLRNVDIVARYGGEEFVVVIPDSKFETAIEVSERIRSSIARHRFTAYEVSTRVTVSIGVALFPDDIPETLRSGEHPELANELIQRADRALYRAKDEGRNRVVSFRDL